MKFADLKRFTTRVTYEETPANKEKMRQILREMGYEPDNLYQELEMESPMVDTHRDVSYTNEHLLLHSHAFCELLYCRSSCGAEYLLGTERYRLQRGDIVFVPPGISHRPLLPENMPEPYKRYVVWMSPLFMEHLKTLLGIDFSPQPSLLRTAGTRWEFLQMYFQNGVKEAEGREEAWQTMVLGNTVCLMTHLYRATQDRSSHRLQAEKPELLDRILAYIEENLAGRITLADTAQYFYLSQSTVSQLFREKLGVSFYNCVTQRRLIAAKERIQQGENLENVGRNVGFADYSSFYRAFRKAYGINPRQYRKLWEENPYQNLPPVNLGKR